MVTQSMPTPSLLNGPRRLLRMALLGVLMTVMIIFASSIYYRRQITERLDRAMSEVNLIPAQAYMIIKPINDYSNLLTFGGRRQAQQLFIDNLYQSTQRALSSEPYPTMNAFQNARQAMNIMKDLGPLAGIDIAPLGQAVVATALETLPRIREQGTISGWYAAAEFFDYVNELGLAEGDAFGGDYSAWREMTFNVPTQPLAMRDAQENAALQFKTALAQIELEPQTVDGPMMAMPPSPLPDESLISMERMLDSSVDMLEGYQQRFGGEQLPRELAGMQAKLWFNRGVLKLAHLQERGSSAVRMGSEYVAEQTLRRGMTAVPDTAELTASFLEMSWEDLRRASAVFAELETASLANGNTNATGHDLPPVTTGQPAAIYRLLQVLAHHNMAMIRQLQQRPNDAWLRHAERLASTLQGEELRWWNEQRSQGRPLLVLRVP